MYWTSSVKTVRPVFWASSLKAVEPDQKENRTSQECAETSLEPIEHFASNTSIHGFKYVFQPRRRFIERCIWVTSVMMCAAAAASLVFSSLHKFYEDPTITSVRSFWNRTVELPFPAVTFCNMNLIFRYKVNRLLDTLMIPESINISRERLGEILPNVGVLIRPHIDIDADMVDDLHTLQQIFHANKMATWRVVKMLSQSCEDMIERCSWNGVLVDCAKSFQISVSFNGYCCSFNYDRQTQWTGHPDKDPSKLRTDSYGVGSGLRVLLNPMREEYMWGTFLSAGFTVVVHRSNLYPEGAWSFVDRSEAYIRMTPDFRDGDPKLREVHPAKRKCTFWDERPLKTHTRYSRERCTLECRAQAVQTLCGCVPYYYIRPDASENSARFTLGPLINSSMVFCNLNHVLCMRRHSRDIFSESTAVKCNCGPQCTFLSYGASLTKSNFEALEYFVGDFYNGMNTSGRISVNVYFSGQVAQVTSTDIIYTVEQLLSNLGGIFSLLLGCSLLSGMEVIYYAFLRAPQVCGQIYKRSSRLLTSALSLKSTQSGTDRRSKVPTVEPNM